MTKLLEQFETQLISVTSTIHLQTQDPIIIRGEIPDLLSRLKTQSAELTGFEKETD